MAAANKLLQPDQIILSCLLHKAQSYASMLWPLKNGVIRQNIVQLEHLRLRILQITDPHILPSIGQEIYGADTFKSLQSVLQSAIALSEPPDIVIVTGDLSEDGSKTSYLRLRGLLLELKLPVYVVPGNHDSIANMQSSLLGKSIQMKTVLDLEDWRIIFLNSKVANASHGYLDQNEMQLLHSTLKESPKIPTITCLHHGPINPCPSKGCQLQNSGIFLSTLSKHQNARVVLAGHAHLELKKQIGGVTLLTTPATSSLCIHAQKGANANHEDFWDSHTFDATRRGFRIIDIQNSGNFDSEVHWVH